MFMLNPLSNCYNGYPTEALSNQKAADESLCLGAFFYCRTGLKRALSKQAPTHANTASFHKYRDLHLDHPKYAKNLNLGISKKRDP